jgi:hypothetical protein
MRFSIPNTITNAIQQNFNNHDKIIISKNNDYYMVKALENINKNEIILVEYPECVLYGENDVDRGLQVVKKYMESMDTEYIKELYPRNFNKFESNITIKNIHKIIKYLDNKEKHTSFINTILDFFKQYTKKHIEFYYAKYLYNAFEGYQYGPLTLPNLAKFNHSCKNNNIIFKFDDTKGCMIVKTTKNITKGNELFNSYLYNKNILNHQQYLLEHYNFKCDC